MMKRILDLILALTIGGLLLLPLGLLALLIRLITGGPVLYWSPRVGRNNQIFKMPKFRSMHPSAPTVAKHMLQHPKDYFTRLGYWLRQTSLDELPQLWSILIGKMSFVGPRPVLPSETGLIELRTQHGIHHLMPGLTGWAQINGRDTLQIEEKVQFDLQYLQKQSLLFDLYILSITMIKIFTREGITH